MKQIVLDELRLSTSIALCKEEVVPRFRAMTPGGSWMVFVPLPDDIGERQRRMQLLYGFLAWKSATAFVMSSELVQPEVLISAAVSRDDVLTACRAIIRKPLSVGPVQWLPKEAVGEEVIALLPRGRINLDPDTIAELEKAFGRQGEFEATRG